MRGDLNGFVAGLEELLQVEVEVRTKGTFKNVVMAMRQ